MAIENLAALEQSVGLEPGKLAEMISSEENHNLSLDDYVIKPKTDYDSYITNIKKESGTASLEIAIKNARNELGLDFQGKTMDNLLKSYAAKVESDAKVDPNKKYDALKTDFEKVQGNLTEWEQKYTSLEQNIAKEKNQRVIKNTLLKEIPDNTSIDKEDILAILMARNEFNVGENGFEIIKDGQVLKNDSNLNPVTANEFMKSFITPYLKKTEGGAGGSDSSGGGKETSFESFNKRMEAQSINIGSEAYNEALAEGMSKGTIKM